MKSATRQKLKQTIAAAALFCTATQPTFAALIQFSTVPLFMGASVTPQVMLTISKDQQLYKKAYNDYSDLDGDGNIETTYKHTIKYYGYFDPLKCYDYSNSARFEPKTNSFIEVDPTNPAARLPGLCTNQWSGNFLNWASMSRMDAVRKLLYGGMRSIDETYDAKKNPVPVTVLERSYLPTDAHAWAKHYNPDPIADPKEQPPVNRLTPFTTLTAPLPFAQSTTAAYSIPTAAGDYPFDFQTTKPAGIELGDQITMSMATGSITGTVLSFSGTNNKIVTLRVSSAGFTGSGSSSSWTLRNLSSVGISFCNMTPGGTGADARSSTNTKAPLIRVAKGNFALWSANERVQCQWAGERSNLQSGFAGGLRSNGNQATLSGIAASAENPDQGVHDLSSPGSVKGEYVARVQVCVPTLEGSEKCKKYPNGNLKPIGLLQEYGDTDRLYFGLMTGSYSKNISGGVLRKNIGSFSSEVRTGSDGAFTDPNAYRPLPIGARTMTSPPTTPGIVNTLNYMRIYGYNYGDGSYLGAAGDNCTYQLTNIIEGDCTSWGNPMSETFFEALRYFAAQKAQYQYSTSSSKDNELGLPLATWTDPMANQLYCAPLNMIVFNASVSTNDDDLRLTGTGSINGTSTVGALTTNVGNYEGITGNKFFIGRTPASIFGTTEYELCTPKTIDALGDASGICPEGPTLAGSYLIAGLAHHAKTNRIRTAASLPSQVPPVPAADTKALKVTSFGIQLATNTPELSIAVPGKPGQRVVIQPIYRLDLNGTFGGGALVDMKFVSQSVNQATGISTGKVYVNWEDSEQGGDYDQDMWGTLEWVLDMKANTIAVKTNAIAASTANPQGFGYTISGTNKDGPHFHSGIIGFKFIDTTGAVAQPSNIAGCADCRLAADPQGTATSQTGPQTVTYTLSTTPAAGSLKDPLWYLAKYGGFNDTNGNGIPDQVAEWDAKKANGDSGADTIPDNYFAVTNPLGLEESLRRAFDAAATPSTGTSVAANTTSLQVGSTVYGAQFNPRDWSGNLQALPIKSDGTLDKPTWDAQVQFKTGALTPDKRNILTYDDTLLVRDGTYFKWPDPLAPAALTISAGLITALSTSPDTGVADARGQQRLDYLRGDQSNEVVSATSFRARSTVLGDIINSNPVYVEKPNAPIFDTTYTAFRTANTDRMPMVYVGANDGMLHGFDAATGTEQIAYVPGKTFPNLAKLTSTNYVHRSFVDGSPEVGDAFVNGAYRTVLVGALAGGGQGLFALDVTKPDVFKTTSPRELVLWEFNDADDRDLGYVYGQPVIRKMANNRWAAIVSAGYNNTEADGNASTTGNGVLYIIFLDGPTGLLRTWVPDVDYIKIDTGVGLAASGTNTPNGLARPLAADTDANGKVNYVYAGDLQGNLWKFDLSSSTPSNWKLSSRRVVLFKATDAAGTAQPITGQAEGVLHPGGKGFMITFGTGKYLETSDIKSPYQTQSFYGIWDKNDRPGSIDKQTVVQQGAGKGRNQLLQQAATDTVANGRTVRTSTDFVPTWSTDTTPPAADDSPTKHMGWYMDFPDSTTSGERSVFIPLIRGGRLIFNTLIPNQDPCLFGGTSVLMLLDPATGSSFNSAMIDVSGDGKLNSDDLVGSGATAVYASGLKSEVGITNTPRLVARPTDVSGGAGAMGLDDPRKTGAGIRENYAIMCGSSGACVSPILGLSSATARVSWRELLRD